MMIPRHYENLKVLHENTMQPRAYFIPASERRNDLVEHREESDRIQFLNGQWNFKFYESVYYVKEAFYEKNFDLSDFDKITVPSVWQMAGYDKNQYTNIRYPFPFDPPYVPQDIPCGAYVYEFEYKKDEKAPLAHLNFEGVDSCFYLWLNGEYIGYSQVSHVTSEFDITGFIKEGKNKIAVLVLKWCDGSYLEDQDKFRMSGIFRDVYIIKRPKRAIRDYRIETKISDNMAEAKISFEYLTDAEKYTVTLLDKEIEIAKAEIGDVTEALFQVENPKLWSAECPYLYTVVIENENETIVDYIGFRKIEIRGNVIYFNDQKIVFHGINRHDSDPQTGFTISIEQLMKDMTLMKQHNFNAIRSSHYPNAPYFYQLCDKYGFMIVNEADIEAHGPVDIYYKDNTDRNKFSRWNEKIADDSIWEESILDRVKLMVHRDKNRPSILIWSMGNESAYGCNFEKALKWTKEYDPARITHYESARYRNYDVTYDYSNLDLYSRMYPALEEIYEYMEKDASKPLLLVEYCHSMGNGPGDFENYFELFQKYDIMCGGFVWEWCDHAVFHGKNKEGKDIYYYGGNHGEMVHDGNFCMDGLVYPDRTPHTGLLEYKNVYRPARVVAYDQNRKKLVLHNYMDFTNLEDYLEIGYEVQCDGIIVERGKVPVYAIEPHKETEIDLDINIPSVGKVYLKLTYYLNADVPLIERGAELGFDEILLHNKDERNQTVVQWSNPHMKSGINMDVVENDMEVIISGKNFRYVYDKRTGLFHSLSYAGKEYLDKPMELNIWKAPTDNDMYAKLEWKRARYDQAYTRAYITNVKELADRIEIKSTMSMSAATVQRMLDIEAKWVIDNLGGINVELNVKRNMEFPELPRFGIRLFLNKDFEKVSYYGMGPTESYCDKHRAAWHSVFQAKVGDLHEDYIKPQENGSHYDCDYVFLSSEKYGMAAVSEKGFSFNASQYTQEELETKKHNYELEISNSTILCLDYALNGIGSNSCGPKVMDEYRFDDEEFQFHIRIVPFEK